MFLIVPAILVFLCMAYLQLNDNLNIYIKTFIYIFNVLIIFISFYIFKIIKKDTHQQEINKIQLEINKLIQKLKYITDKNQKNYITSEINMLKKELKDITNQ